jgi:hypothetical protein
LDANGFVASGDHFDWPVRTRQDLEKRHKIAGFSLARMAADDAAAGKAVRPQMVTWATLAYLVDEDVPRLHGMLTELAALHAERDAHGSRGTYSGDADRTIEVLQRHLDPLDPADLIAWLKKR